MKNALQKETPPIRLGEKFGFGTFSAASNIIFYFKDLFYLFFLTNVLGIRLAMALDEGSAAIGKAVDGMDKPYAVIGVTEKG